MPTELNNLQQFDAYCRGAGIKVTHQRTEIYRELIASAIHPDVETIYARVRKRIPVISLDTVYRTLRMLEEKGIIARVGLAGERTRFDVNTERHHHFVCSQCGLIADFYSDVLDSFQPQPEVQTLGNVDSVHVELRGRCRKCRKRP